MSSTVGPMSIKRGCFGGNLPVAEKDAGNQAVVDAVIAAPGLVIRVEHRFRDLADGGLPGGAIAPLVAHDEVRRGFRVRAAVDLRCLVDALHGGLLVLGVGQGGQLGGDFPAQGGGFRPRLDAALRLPPLEIQKDAGQADGEGPRLRPIDRGQVFLPAQRFVDLEVAGRLPASG